MARPISLILYLFQLASNILSFRKDYSAPPLVRHLDPTIADLRYKRERGVGPARMRASQLPSAAREVTQAEEGGGTAAAAR